MIIMKNIEEAQDKESLCIPLIMRLTLLPLIHGKEVGGKIQIHQEQIRYEQGTASLLCLYATNLILLWVGPQSLNHASLAVLPARCDQIVMLAVSN